MTERRQGNPSGEGCFPVKWEIQEMAGAYRRVGILQLTQHFRSRVHRAFLQRLQVKSCHWEWSGQSAVDSKSSATSDHRSLITGHCYRGNCASIAVVTSLESGVTAGSKRSITVPFRSTRNFVKFHWISPAMPAPVSLVR